MVLGITIAGPSSWSRSSPACCTTLDSCNELFSDGWLMQRVMRTSGSESLCTSANVFMGQTETAADHPALSQRHDQEQLMTMMVGGMATLRAVCLLSMPEWE